MLGLVPHDKQVRPTLFNHTLLRNPHFVVVRILFNGFSCFIMVEKVMYKMFYIKGCAMSNLTISPHWEGGCN